MNRWRLREYVVSAGMAALAAAWLTSAWGARDWAPAYNLALRIACGLACCAVATNPGVLFERSRVARLFAGTDLRAIAYSLFAALGIAAAVLALALWLSKPLWHGR
jgi:hypothetical protein